MKLLCEIVPEAQGIAHAITLHAELLRDRERLDWLSLIQNQQKMFKDFVMNATLREAIDVSIMKEKEDKKS